MSAKRASSIHHESLLQVQWQPIAMLPVIGSTHQLIVACLMAGMISAGGFALAGVDDDDPVVAVPMCGSGDGAAVVEDDLDSGEPADEVSRHWRLLRL